MTSLCGQGTRAHLHRPTLLPSRACPACAVGVTALQRFLSGTAKVTEGTKTILRQEEEGKGCGPAPSCCDGRSSRPPWQSCWSGMAGSLLPCPSAGAQGSPPCTAAEESRKRVALACASCWSCRQPAGTSSAGPSQPTLAGSTEQPWERDSNRNSCAW